MAHSTRRQRSGPHGSVSYCPGGSKFSLLDTLQEHGPVGRTGIKQKKTKMFNVAGGILTPWQLGSLRYYLIHFLRRGYFPHPTPPQSPAFPVAIIKSGQPEFMRLLLTAAISISGRMRFLLPCLAPWTFSCVALSFCSP